MPKLIILYGPPDDPATFEDSTPHAASPTPPRRMPGVTGAENLRVVGAPEGASPRLSHLAAHLRQHG